MIMKNVLLIEDDTVERQVIREALEAFPGIALELVASSAEAIAYLEGQGDWADREKHPLPILVVLDLQLGNPTGLELLRWLKGQEVIRRIPVIGVCTPFSQEIVNKAYDDHINCAVARRVQASDFSSTVHALLNFWLNINQPPVLEREPGGNSIIDL